MRTLIFSLAAALAPGFLPGGELPLPEYRSIGEGVWYGRGRVETPGLVYHAIKIDRESAGPALKPIRPRREEALSELAARLGAEKTPLLGAITGDYFNYIREYGVVLPWGILVQEGNLVFSPTGKSAFCGTAEVFSISVPEMRARLRNPGGPAGVRVAAVNRPLEPEETDCGLFNAVWGDFAWECREGFAVTVSGEGDFRLDRGIEGKVTGISRLPVKVPIPARGFVAIMKELPPPDQLEIKLGAAVLAEIEVSPALESAIGGGPRLVRNGEISIELDREDFGPGRAFYIKSSRHPRSAVGIGPEGKFIYLVVIEGRSDRSRGATLAELAGLLVSLGATEAMAFDGGRSVSMHAAGSEAVRGDRQMANALAVFRVKP